MTKVTVNHEAKPSEQVVAEAKREVVVKDARGREIGLRKPGVLAQYRLPKVLGPELSENATYMKMVLPLLFVVSLEGQPVAFPQTDREIEALIQRLDEDGIVAVLHGVEANFGAQDPEATKADVKN